MEKLMTAIGTIMVSLILIFIACLIEGVIVMWLWDWLLVDDNILRLTTENGDVLLPKITWLQGFGLSLLGNTLFGGTHTTTNKD